MSFQDLSDLVGGRRGWERRRDSGIGEEMPGSLWGGDITNNFVSHTPCKWGVSEGSLTSVCGPVFWDILYRKCKVGMCCVLYGWVFSRMRCKCARGGDSYGWENKGRNCGPLTNC